MEVVGENGYPLNLQFGTRITLKLTLIQSLTRVLCIKQSARSMHTHTSSNNILDTKSEALRMLILITKGRTICSWIVIAECFCWPLGQLKNYVYTDTCLNA